MFHPGMSLETILWRKNVNCINKIIIYLVKQSFMSYSFMKSTAFLILAIDELNAQILVL